MKKKLVVLGAGESGVGAALLGQKQGYDVFVSDKGTIAPKYQTELEVAGIPFESGEHTEGVILSADIIVKSPGIPDKVALVQAAKNKGIPVISEIEWGFRFCSGKIIAITGSNGKTTTTNLVYHLLKTAGWDVAVGGNIGYSFAELVVRVPRAFYVLEVSSFQLDGIVDFRPDIAILTNITPDHLDRYDYTMSKYVASKFRITMNQTPSDIFIFNSDNIEIQNFMKDKTFNAQLLPIGQDFEGDQLRGVFDMAKTPIKGPHNYFNAACAIEAARAVGVPDDAIQRGLETFVNAPHRLEFVAEVNGVTYINDSKATNVDSVYWALKAMTQPTVLILGGLDKGNDYTQILDLVKEKVKAIVCMGVDNSKIVHFFSSHLNTIIETHSAADAVQQASRLTEGGDVVLLSPACASFDLFKNYEDRGEQFKQAVRQLLAT